ncbi:MAG: nucleotidyltransferase domain-containing protein [Gammaproteobacteria bacterium]|nr:nucleotidyltransferase domain-containing protein [Gammaproteobacteria bacterium]
MDFLKKEINISVPDAGVYLFGSRTDDAAKGGDIDILILSEKPVDSKTARQIRVNFYKRFDWQKLDLVNFTFAESHPFKTLIMNEAIKL